MTVYTETRVVCDTCGEQIDVTQPYYHVDDPSNPDVLPKDFHTDHVPSPSELKLEAQ